MQHTTNTSTNVSSSTPALNGVSYDLSDEVLTFGEPIHYEGPSYYDPDIGCYLPDDGERTHRRTSRLYDVLDTKSTEELRETYKNLVAAIAVAKHESCRISGWSVKELEQRAHWVNIVLDRRYHADSNPGGPSPTDPHYVSISEVEQMLAVIQRESAALEQEVLTSSNETGYEGSVLERFHQMMRERHRNELVLAGRAIKDRHSDKLRKQERAKEARAKYYSTVESDIDSLKLRVELLNREAMKYGDKRTAQLLEGVLESIASTEEPASSERA